MGVVKGIGQHNTLYTPFGPEEQTRTAEVMKMEKVYINLTYFCRWAALRAIIKVSKESEGFLLCIKGRGAEELLICS